MVTANGVDHYDYGPSPQDERQFLRVARIPEIWRDRKVVLTPPFRRGRGARPAARDTARAAGVMDRLWEVSDLEGAARSRRTRG
jgi:hypothetical protein